MLFILIRIYPKYMACVFCFGGYAAETKHTKQFGPLGFGVVRVNCGGQKKNDAHESRMSVVNLKNNSNLRYSTRMVISAPSSPSAWARKVISPASPEGLRITWQRLW